MKKNRNSIFPNIPPQRSMWKLGSFFSIIFTFFSAFLYASENPSSENFVHANSVIEEAQLEQPEKTVINIAEGTIVYGLENMSQNTEIKSTVEIKSIRKNSARKTKSIAVTKEAPQKVKAKQAVKSIKATAHVYSHQSQNSFTISNQQLSIGTLASNHSFKALTIHHDYTVTLMQPSDVNATDKYTFSFTLNTMYSHSFTRPPPPFI